MKICLSCARARLRNPSVPLCASCACEVKLTSRDRLKISVRKSASGSTSYGYRARWAGHPSLFKPRAI